MLPIIDESGSDSATLDNALEFLVQAGRSLPHAAMMLIPEPWDKNPHMTDPKRAFYEYHSTLMEPWMGRHPFPLRMVESSGRFWIEMAYVRRVIMKRKTIRLFILRKRALCQWIRVKLFAKKRLARERCC